MWNETGYNSLVVMQVPLPCYVTLGTQLCCQTDLIPAGECVRVHVRCAGGKGGYGNTLRALGRKGGITDNVSDCRDLQGRRLRDVEAAKRLAASTSDLAERKRAREAEEHEAKLARKAAQLASKKDEEQVFPMHNSSYSCTHILHAAATLKMCIHVESSLFAK